MIDILVAMVLFSMTLLLLFSGLFTANQYWKAGERTIEKNEDVRLLSQFIRKQVSQAVPLLWVEKGERKLLFQGEHNELRFVSTLPAHRGGGGLRTLVLKIVETDTSKKLGLHYALLHPDQKPFSNSNHYVYEKNSDAFVVIANDIEAIELSYFGKTKNDEEAHWLAVWNSENYMPQIVRMQIYFKNQDANTSNLWPPINIPIHASFVRGRPEFIIRSLPLR